MIDETPEPQAPEVLTEVPVADEALTAVGMVDLAPPEVVALTESPVVGSVEPALIDALVTAAKGGLPTTDVPFPHDVGSVHALDSLPVYKATKINETQIEVLSDASVQIHPLVSGDVFEHLPVGAFAERAPRTATFVGLLATADRPSVASFGSGVHEAARGVWPFLVTEGHAKAVRNL